MKCHGIATLLLVAWFAAGAALGAEDVVRATGRGASDKEAVQDALINAIAQHDGVSLDVATQLSVEQQDRAVTVDGTSQTRGDLQSTASRDTQQKIKGRVSRYTVVSCEQQPNSRWIAEVDVVFFRYETPGLSPDSRRKLVVAPFDSVPGGFSVTGRQVSAQEITASFRDRLETQLVQSRRFAVLGRQDTDAILREKKLILSESTDPGEYAKIGATLGTDYIVCGKVSGLEVDKGTVHSPFTDAVLPQIRSARIALNYRILVMPTAQIKWAGEVDIDLDPDHCLELGGDETAACDALLDAAARAVCAQALGNIYPVRAVKLLDGGEVVLNQGGTLLWEGETFDVFRLGEPIVDPYTHETLGRDESRIATIQVVRVDAKLSYARVLDGTIPAEAVAANRVVCRPPRLGFAVPAPAEEPAIKPPTATTGVRLPFD